MYSPLVVDQNLHAARKAGHKFVRRDKAECIAITERLELLLDVNNQPKRPYTADEQAFIRSEQILCHFDFRYWAERYGYCERDASEGGGVSPVRFWPSQERALELISQREEENYAYQQKHKFSEGILVVWHKTRQQGATGIARLISMHRMTNRKNTRCIAASLDGDKVHELYTRDLVALDNLPSFLKPKIEYDVKDSHLGFEILKSRITYQQANQQAGVGTGQQFDVSHMTEVALWAMPERLQFDFMPAVPQAPSTFVGFESTANGRGDFWHGFTENVRKRTYGFGSWIYVFTPWYINANKNRRIPFDGWAPTKITQEMCELVERTSAEFVGKKVVLNRDQMYWWETEYELNKKQGTLNVFLTNYPSTPEQSFQHTTSSALPLETIEWMRAGADIELSMPYMVEVNSHRA